MRLVVPVCLAVAACSGSGGDTELPVAEVARIEIAPAAMTLTPGDTRQAVAHAFAADGTEVAAEVTWSSSRPDVAVDAAGNVSAEADLGAAQLVATVDGVRSAPALVTIIEPAPGVTLVDDAQVVEPPRAVDSTVFEDLDAVYEVVLRGPAPAVGSLLLGREGVSIGGEVVASVAEGDTARVQLRMVPLPRLVANAALAETVDGAAVAPEFPSELAAAYDITVDNGEYTFTPKPGLKLKPAIAMAADGTFALPPIGKCETTLPTLPISLGGLPQVSAKLEPTFDVVYNTKEQVKRFVIKAEPSFKAQVNLVVNVDATVALECKSPLFKRVLKFPGWAGLILAGEIEAGIALELEGKVTLVSAGVELSSETTAKIEIGMQCLGDSCDLVKKIDQPVNTNKVQLVVPAIGQARVEPSLFGGGYAALKLGATLVEQARAEMVKAKIGGKYEASLAPATLQTENIDPNPDYRSSYGLSLFAKVGAGKKLGGVLAKLGIQEFVPLELSTSVPLASSPKGTATIDRTSFAVGDTVKFKVQLDPKSIALPAVGYNIERILILHKRFDQFIPVEVASIAPTQPNQVAFELSWVADVASKTAGTELFAFVDTMLPIPVDLELAKVSPAVSGAPPCVPAGNARFCIRPLTGNFGRAIAVSSNGTVLTDAGRLLRADGTVVVLPQGLIADSINDRDEVVGRVSSPNPGFAVVTNGAISTFVPEPRPVTAKINNRGELAMVARPPGDTTGHQFRATLLRRDAAGNPLPIEAIEAPVGSNILSIVLDDRGTLAFGAFDDNLIGSPFLVANGVTTRVPVTGEVPTVLGIDSRGTIAGTVASQNAWAFADGVFRTLPRPGPEDASVLGVTDLGVIGQTTRGEPLLWSAPDFAAVELRSLVEANVFYDLLLITTAKNGVMAAEVHRSDSGPGEFVLIVPAATTNTNLDVEIVAPPTVEPSGTITYGVNLRNFGPATAADVRAEFTLPAGATFASAEGWRSCEATQSTVTCVADSLAAGEQRAFLVEVIAPVDEGTFTASARVASATHDSDYANNEERVTTTVSRR